MPQWLGVNEVSMIVAGNGDWVAACRIDYPKRFARYQFDHYGGLGISISKDRGKTWSDMKRLYEWGRHHPSMVLLPDKRILMTYVVRLGYPNNAQGFPQFGVEAMISSDNGQTWDFGHRYVLATWCGTLKDERSWFCSVQSTSTVRLPDGTLPDGIWHGVQQHRRGHPLQDGCRAREMAIGLSGLLAARRRQHSQAGRLRYVRRRQ